MTIVEYFLARMTFWKILQERKIISKFGTFVAELTFAPTAHNS